MTRKKSISTVNICTILFFATSALAQGTATGPSTFHYADPGGVVYIGGTGDSVNGPGPTRSTWTSTVPTVRRINTSFEVLKLQSQPERVR